jgi:type IV pilus assembly protein PilY1
MLHAFNASTGKEIFAYIPKSVYGNLIKLVNPYYNVQHQFYVDASPQGSDVQFSDNSWHTLLVGSERAGGSGIFALDVTDPTQFDTEAHIARNVLWEFNDANMGLSFSLPVAVNSAAGWVVMFGNGYNSPTGQPYLYALNPQTGAQVAKINLCGAVPSACNSAKANGLSNIVTMNTYGALLSGSPNVVYAGDLQGNLWRVDISNSNPANWTVTVLFQARDGSGNAQPITVTPNVTLNPLAPQLTGAMVYFGTGQFLGLPDLGTTGTQSIYGIYDSGTPPSSPYTRANLIQQTMTSATGTNSSGVTVTLYKLSNNPVNLPSAKGWYVDMTLNPGDRVVTDPVLFDGTLQVHTYQPNASTCVGGGNATYLVFNYATGGATTVPQFDWNGDGAVNNGDLLSGQIVSGMALGTSYAAAPKMVTMGDQAVVYSTMGAAEVSGLCNGSSCDRNVLNADSLARGAWQEIR